MSDLTLIESKLGGGDVVLQGNDLHITTSWRNMPYLGMFGGNVKQSTKGQKKPGEQAFYWWGNTLYLNNPSIQLNSETEKKLMNVALNSAGRIEIEEIIKSDLKFMQDFAEVSVSVTLKSVARARIEIKVQEPGNLEDNTFTFIWDGMRLETEDLGSTKTLSPGGFSSGFSSGFNV